MLTDEFEIKVSKSDFLADAKKRVRFKLDKGYSDWMLKSEAYSKGLMPTNYFWYVSPIGLLNRGDIPEYAGLLEVYDSGTIFTAKQAPKTRKDKMPEKDIIKHLCKASVKYWSMAAK